MLKLMTVKNDDATFWEMNEVKILPPSISFNFDTLKSH